MQNKKELKTKLNKNYKSIINTPKNDIDFDFFLAINEYVRYIDQSDYLRILLHGSSSFDFFSPYNLLIERGRSVSDLNDFFKARKVPIIRVAYFNLYSVYVAIEDMDDELDKDNIEDSLLENRVKMARHVRNIQNREKIVGTGYFWFHKKKYYEWARIVHRFILDLIDNDTSISSTKKTDEKKEKVDDIKEVPAENSKEKVIDGIEMELTEHSEPKELVNDASYDYNYDLANKMVCYTFRDKGIVFNGKRATIFHFFYMSGQSDNNNYKTFHDFNKFMTDNSINEKIDSISFRQGIDSINKRIRDEIEDVKKVIVLETKNSPKETNRYKWKMEI